LQCTDVASCFPPISGIVVVPSSQQQQQQQHAPQQTAPLLIPQPAVTTDDATETTPSYRDVPHLYSLEVDT
ncbi:hypothetical protein L9F63_002342, partial [Diploptera punctata]